MTIARRCLVVTAVVGLSGCAPEVGLRDATLASAAASKAPPPAPAQPWVIPDPLLLTLGGVFDVSATLPQGVVRGGVFFVDPASAALPAGLTLTPQGLLKVAATAAPFSVSGVVLGYTEP